PFSPRAPAFSPDGKLLAWIDTRGAVVLADPFTGKERRRLLQADEARRVGNQTNAGSGGLLFAPDSKTIALLGAYGSRMTVWDVGSGKQSWNIVARPVVQAVNVRTIFSGRAAFSPDGKMLSLGGEGGAVRFFDATTGKEIHADRHQSPIVQLS